MLRTRNLAVYTPNARLAIRSTEGRTPQNTTSSMATNIESEPMAIDSWSDKNFAKI